MPTWLGTMSTITPMPAAWAAVANLPQAVDSAARRVDGGVVDDVVAVLGSGLGGQDR